MGEIQEGEVGGSQWALGGYPSTLVLWGAGWGSAPYSQFSTLSQHSVSRISRHHPAALSYLLRLVS